MPLSLPNIVSSGGMKRRTIIPDGQVVIRPAEANLEIMALSNNAMEMISNQLILRSRESIDAANAVRNLLACSKERFPPRHGIGANDGMRGFELEAAILGGAASTGVQLRAAFGGDLLEKGSVVCGGEAFGNLLKHGGEPVVGLVAGCPEGVSATILGSRDDFEKAVIGRYGLESDAVV